MALPAGSARSGSWCASCVLLERPVRPGAPVGSAEQLIDALRQRGVSVIPNSGVYDAMATVLVHEQNRRRGAVSDPMVVVLVEPRLNPDGPVFFEAAARYAPHAVFWQYEPDPSPRLTAYRPAPAGEEESRSAAAVVEPAREAALPAAPRLRLTHDPSEIEFPGVHGDATRQAGSAHSPPPRREGGAAAVLTDEELAMLLGDPVLPKDGPARGGGPAARKGPTE